MSDTGAGIVVFCAVEPGEAPPETDQEEGVGEALRSAAACRRLSASDGED